MNETTMSTLVLQPLVTVPLRGHRGIFYVSCLAFSLCYLSLRSLFSFFFPPFAAPFCCARTPGSARREAQSQREIKSINMWEAHATHSSVCSTRNNLHVSSSHASERARPVPREALVLRLDAETLISG